MQLRLTRLKVYTNAECSLAYASPNHLFSLSKNTGFPGAQCPAEDPGSNSGSGRSLEKGIAAHSSVLAWRIPWTEEPGRLYNLATDQQQLSTNISNLITVDGKITDFKSTE